jgi:hypothetical protein
LQPGTTNLGCPIPAGVWPSSDAKEYSLIGRQPLHSRSLQRGERASAQDVLDELEDLGVRIATAIQR